tara:strand:- start:4029 stop:4286 length:258 start_codon:yes stop_codon:yes gene_type:complete
MKNRIELTIEHKDHYTVELTNGNGDTFTYNPQKHEGLEDFLSGAKILLIADVSNSRLDELEQENKKLRFMVENGLGEKDLENDCC